MNGKDRMIITLDDLVVEFASNYSLGMKAIYAASETYVTAILKYPSRARREFATRFPTIRQETWAILEDIGHNRLPPEAVMMAPGAVSKLRAAKLPRKLAAEIASRRVTVYNPVNGKYNDIPFSNLTESQADIVLNPVSHSIRTKAQQKRYIDNLLKSQRMQSVENPEEKPVRSPSWIIIGDEVLVKKMTRFTLRDLQEIVRRLESDAS